MNPVLGVTDFTFTLFCDSNHDHFQNEHERTMITQPTSEQLASISFVLKKLEGATTVVSFGPFHFF
jgi:hypothetical protein